VLVGGVGLYLAGFIVVGTVAFPEPGNLSDEVLIIRALGTAAFVLLHVILCIGPAARLDARFAALLYNRRHMGVTMFALALAHAAISIGYYGGFGVRNPLLAMLGGYGSLVPGEWPFELFGLIGLVMLFLMAATSHDFWLANLSAATWKTLHMGVYLAYAALVMHVTLGFLRDQTSIEPTLLVGAGIALVAGLHVAAGVKERRAAASQDPCPKTQAPSWIDACAVTDIPEGRAKVVCVPGSERIAIFRNGETISAVTNVCAHQGGPLGEGKIVGGCITCPWHGYQYRSEDGCSPPPYTEKIHTYQVRVEGSRVMVNPDALPPGTRVEPARVMGARDG
jgi:nitrite reductase/ring-hydroxylating ferredoxin subunit/DMSO/TMAO reductase YedYZ heme-binding membrane subunit